MRLAALLAERCGLGTAEEAVLDSQVVALDRRARRLYHRTIEPRLPTLRHALETHLRARAAEDPATPRRWAELVALAVDQRGFATIAEQLVIDAVGRQEVARALRLLRDARAR